MDRCHARRVATSSGYQRPAFAVVAASIVCLAFLTAHVRADLRQALNAALASVPHSQTTIAACVLDLESGRAVFERNAHESVVPASTMKIFTMAVAIEELGAAFEFETVLGTDGVHLYVIGDGDPAFGDPRLAQRRGESTDAEFVRWARILSHHGAYNIPGDLIIDESVFDQVMLHPNWDPDDLGKWYAAPVGGLNFNDNCIELTLTPTQPGAPAAVQVHPTAAVIHVVNKTRSSRPGKPVLHHHYDSMEYTVSGNCPKKWPFGSVAFPDPGLLFAETMRATFAGERVTFSGSVRRQRVRRPDGTVPSSISVLARHRTPLADVLGRAGKNSQNLFAEALLKRAGYAWSRRHRLEPAVGSWANGANAVRDMMLRVGVDIDGFHVVDGSGLSRQNRCTPSQQAGTLAWINQQPWADLFRQSLSIAGVDGSLSKRLKDHPNRVVAKTGTMRSVRALTGFVMGPHGPKFAFSVVFNGYPGPSTPYRAVQDEFCRALIRAADGP